jgi:predicted nucleic acid-binding protein
MLGIDTNVVIRLIISDDAEQTRRARKLIEQALKSDEPVLVSLLVLLESEWVLRSRGIQSRGPTEHIPRTARGARAFI